MKNNVFSQYTNVEYQTDHTMTTSWPRRNHRKISLLSWYWGLLSIIPIGYGLTVSPWLGEDYTSWSLAAFVCLVILLRSLKDLFVTRLPIWIMLFIWLVGYYVQFYWFELALRSDTAVWQFHWKFYRIMQSPDVMTRVFSLFSLGFCVFAVTAALVLRLWRHPTTYPPISLNAPESHAPLSIFQKQRLKRQLLLLYFGLLVFSVITGYLQWHFGFAVAGADPVQLPFRLSGWIHHIRMWLIPYLTILVLWLARRSGFQQINRLGWGLLLFHSLSQTILITSRGILFMELLPAFILIFLANRVNRKTVFSLIIVFVMIAMLHPIISEYRAQRQYEGNVVVALDQALSNLASANQEQDMLLALLTTGFGSLFTRVTGTNSLLFMVAWGDPSFDLDHISNLLWGDERGIARWYTQEVMGFGPETLSHLAAPGLVGVFYLLGGWVGIVIGISVWVVFWQGVWSWCMQSKLSTRLVTLSMLVPLILHISTDGTIDGIFLSLQVMVSCVIVGELLVRHFFMRGVR